MLRINFTPFPVLQTDRLLLRCITIEDAPQLFLLRSDEKVMQWLDREPCKTIDDATVFITEKILSSLQKNEGILWVIELNQQPGTLIGTTGFWRFDKDHYRAEIGYMLQSAHWRKGIMTEAVKLTLDWLFSTSEIHSVEANINPGNASSEALLKSVGFVQEAYFKENYYFNGLFKDSVIYSMVKGINR